LVEKFSLSPKMFEGQTFLRDVLAKMRKSKSFQSKIMKGMGGVALAYAQNCFTRQSLGSQVWPERYPKQSAPKVNVAGIVSDFLNGRASPASNRFEARPAGIDSGKLKRSLTPSKALTMSGFSVTVGSVEKHASAVQFGGKSEQEITPGVVDLLNDYMRKSRKRVKGFKRRSTPINKKDAAIQRLGFLFGLHKKGKKLVTESAPRPYLGVTTELEDKLVQFVIDEFSALEKGKNGFEAR
jgi:phage gpG-like protein